MRLFPAADVKFLAALAAFLILSAPAFAQTAAPQSGQATTQVNPLDRASFLQGMQAALSVPGLNATGQQTQAQQAQQNNLGDENDPESRAYKANHLADQAAAERREAAAFGATGEDIITQPPPQEVETLQQVNKANGDTASISDDLVDKSISVDMRRDAQREAALSYGARGGLAKRNYEIMEKMQGFGPVLDRVFNFRALLIKAPSGLMIEPPIVKESVDAMVITEGGTEAAVADKVFDINKRAKIVSAPRDWRQYLLQTWSKVPPPPRVLWPQSSEEQRSWDAWVMQGWQAGIDQAEQIFETNVNRLVADYNGMVRYRMLLEQGMISEPYALHEDRGVTGSKNQMRVGDRALRITGPSQFLMGADLWKPADR